VRVPKEPLLRGGKPHFGLQRSAFVDRYRRAERRIEPDARSETQNRGQLDASATGSCQACQLPAVIGFDRAMRTNLNTQAGTGRHEGVFRTTQLKIVLPIPAGVDEDQSLGLIRDAV
jgi:hypothetical protein